jgi:hypothetical protein
VRLLLSISQQTNALLVFLSLPSIHTCLTLPLSASAKAASRADDDGELGSQRSYAYDMVRTDGRVQTLDAFLRAAPVCVCVCVCVCVYVSECVCV